MRKLLFVILMGSSLIGCNKAIEDFVATSNPSLEPGGSLPAYGPSALKISPGHISSAGSAISMKANVTPTNRRVKSSAISAEFTIHRQRVSQ